ncbi:Double-stranded DNA-binding protein [uncultured Caudovirales phage]|uniref:Double-stranded DNA-binding protein n=1 Tax=uncultured Caudovirales phage TaxID=2100421 RepID=A0A6J7WV10_9CAUD|nr:Double-stranded DNA-binding protein [uncultured Caudovirales phage]
MSLPQDPAARKAIKKCMEEISASMTRTEGERDFIKEAIANICEEYELNKKTIRKLARTYHKQNFSREVAEHEEFETMYEQLTGETSLGDTN